MSFIFDASTETPEEAAQRAALQRQTFALGPQPQNVGQGIARIAEALMHRKAMSDTQGPFPAPPAPPGGGSLVDFGQTLLSSGLAQFGHRSGGLY
jgi:hypothetical protein